MPTTTAPGAAPCRRSGAPGPPVFPPVGDQHARLGI